MQDHTNATRTEFLAAREPTGPEPVSVWQMLRGHRVDPLVRWTAIREQHGDVARYRYGLSDNHFVTHPDGARRVLQDNAPNYTKEHPAYAMLRRVVGRGLLTSEGTAWLRQRRLAQPAFHRQRVAALGARMTAAAVELCERWAAQASAGEPVSMVAEMSRLTLRIVGDALFGDDLRDRAARLRDAWDVLNAQLTDRHASMRVLPPILPTRYDREFRRARGAMFAAVDAIIAERRARHDGGHGGEDLLGMLMSATDHETGARMTDAQLRDEVATMLLAGHETTAVALAWAWALLDGHPPARARLDEELARVLGGRPPTPEDVAQLTWTRAVIDEAMRLYPPAYVLFRRIRDDDVVCGHRVHRGGVVVLSPLVLHRHPAFWDRPDDFAPERWQDAEAERRRPRFAFMPFSAGPRQCIGSGFAVLEAVLVLATLAQRFAPRLADGYRLEPEYRVTLRPRQGLPMRLAWAGGEAASAAAASGP